MPVRDQAGTPKTHIILRSRRKSRLSPAETKAMSAEIASCDFG
jgi:hypothetical protein